MFGFCDGTSKILTLSLFLWYVNAKRLNVIKVIVSSGWILATKLHQSTFSIIFIHTKSPKCKNAKKRQFLETILILQYKNLVKTVEINS